MNQVNLKTMTLEACKAFAWDLQTIIQQYSNMLDAVNQEISLRLKQESAAKQAASITESSEEPAAKVVEIKKGKK
jgi:hypothetical protein